MNGNLSLQIRMKKEVFNTLEEMYQNNSQGEWIIIEIHLLQIEFLLQAYSKNTIQLLSRYFTRTIYIKGKSNQKKRLK